MERLTSNKPVEEMSTVELAHNCCYAKDRLARYRDFEMDMDARDFARNLMATLTDDELPLDDDNFDEEILENLQYDLFSSVTGFIALFYRNLWAMADLREKLKEYEDAEEQGVLLKLPCKVGTSIYMINHYWIDEGRICGIAEADDIDCFCYKVYCDPDDYTMVAVADFNKTWFLTQEEAEQALKQMGE